MQSMQAFITARQEYGTLMAKAVLESAVNACDMDGGLF
jgi:hypothetical protein